MKNIAVRFLFATVCLFLFSCASTSEKKIDSAYVMVYDYENSEVMNVTVHVDEKEVGCTDIYGRLMFECDKEKEVLIKASKKGYETVETKTVIKAGSVIYFKIGSGSYYAAKAEKFLDEHDRENALKMIEKALEIEERKDWQYLQEIIIKESNK